MARTINAGDTKVGRGDVYAVDPREVIIDFDDNARWHKLDHAKVVKYAKSFLSRGQLQPCVGTPGEDGRIKIAYGMHRFAAALLVVNGSKEDGTRRSRIQDQDSCGHKKPARVLH